jgi:hypothetical protein
MEQKRGVKTEPHKISFYGNYGFGTIVYSAPFTRFRSLSVKFKMTENDGQHESFYFGVTTEDCKDEMFWMSKGIDNYLFLFCNTIN